MAEKIGVRASAVILRDNKVLLVKSKYGNEEFYLFPGGGVEENETVEEAAIRETLEETGFEIKIKDLIHVNEYIYKNDWKKRSITFFFLAEISGESSPTTDDGGKVESIEWINFSDLDKYDIRPKALMNLIKNFTKNPPEKKIYSIDYK